MTHARPATPRRRHLCLALAAAIVFLLFYLGAQPFAAGLIPAPWDKLAHFVVFATIAGLLAIGIAGKHPALPIAMAGAIGAIDEWHQTVLPGRSANIADLLTDVSAAVLAVMIYEYLRARQAAAAATSCTRGS